MGLRPVCPHRKQWYLDVAVVGLCDAPGAGSSGLAGVLPLQHWVRSE